MTNYNDFERLYLSDPDVLQGFLEAEKEFGILNRCKNEAKEPNDSADFLVETETSN